MKVLIVNNMAPFVWGGAEELAEHLRRRLIEHGHESEVMRIPFQWEPATRIPSQMLMVRWLELLNVDHVIALKFPAYLIRHERKSLWLLHQYRQAYDLYDVGHTNLVGEDGERIRTMIKSADDEAFAECRRIYVNSEVTQRRLMTYNGVPSTVLLPPVNDPERFTGGPAGDYVFLGGRVNGMKRQHLVVEAMANADARAKIVVAGPPDSPADAARIHEIVELHGLADRVHVDLRMLTREEYAAYVNGAAAVAYLPYDEDSMGYVAMEAATAGKPIITTTDSGGILDLVVHEETGWVVEPNADALAGAVSTACAGAATARALGAGARDRWNGLGVTWDATVEALLR